MEAAVLGPPVSQGNLVRKLDLTSRMIFHTSGLLIALEATRNGPSWLSTAASVAKMQAWIVRPILKGIQIVDHSRELSQELESDERSWFRVGALSNLLAFDTFYVGTALMMGTYLLTGNQRANTVGQWTMTGLLVTLPGIYGGIAIHAILVDQEAGEAGQATLDQLHQNTYDLLSLLLMSTCDALVCGFFHCSVKRWLLPLLGSTAAMIELWRLSTCPEAA